VYAIISDGPHQYRVEEGQELDVERKDLPDDAQTIAFDRVLFVGGADGGPRIGQPIIDGAKYRRRKTYKRRTGHRQRFLRVKIEKIEI
jgi:large subunit ribosomal protein L21